MSRPLFDNPETNEAYLSALSCLEDLRGDLYRLQDLGEDVGEMLDDLYEIEDRLIRKTE
jgi:hypothetical protein